MPRGGGDVRFRLLFLLALVVVAAVFWVRAPTSLTVVGQVVALVAAADLLVALVAGRGRIPANGSMLEFVAMPLLLFGLWAIYGEGTEAIIGVLMYMASMVGWRFVVPSRWLRTTNGPGR